MEYRLLEKTELWVKPVVLSGADLDACARVAAEALGLKGDEVMVTDAMGDNLTFDILIPTIQAGSLDSSAWRRRPGRRCSCGPGSWAPKLPSASGSAL